MFSMFGPYKLQWTFFKALCILRIFQEFRKKLILAEDISFYTTLNYLSKS